MKWVWFALWFALQLAGAVMVSMFVLLSCHSFGAP